MELADIIASAEPKYVLAGFIVGLIIGLTGVGGGSLMTPILMLGFGISPIVAVGTDLAYAAITKSSGIIVHQRRGNIHWRLVGLLALGSVPASLLALELLKSWLAPASAYDSTTLIRTTLSVALILTSIVLLFKAQIIRLGARESLTVVHALHRTLQTPITILCGFIIGVLVTLSSVGAGAIGAAVLLFLYPLLRTAHIVGTDVAHAVPITAIAAFGHYYLGSIDLMLLLNLLAGSLPGIALGGHYCGLLPERAVRLLLAAILCYSGLRMLP